MPSDACSVLITGAGSGIGKHLALTLAKQGYQITVADLNASACQAVAHTISEAGGQAQAVTCDVCSYEQQRALFHSHLEAFGKLDIAILNAGIGEKEPFLKEGSESWQKTLQVDLWAVAVGVQLASLAMRQHKTAGTILVNASAGGLFTMPYAPIYATAKAGCVHLVRSLEVPLAKRRIRISAVCPAPVDTPLADWFTTAGATPEAKAEAKAGLLTVEEVGNAFLYLLRPETPSASIIMVSSRTHKAYRWTEPKGNLHAVNVSPAPAAEAHSARHRQALAGWAAAQSSQGNQAIRVHRLTSNFREAVSIDACPVPSQPPKGHVLVRNAWAGVNASDTNFASGRYFGPKQAQAMLPFHAGFEAVGVVAAVGAGVEGLQVGDPVASVTYGGYTQWALLKAREALPVRKPEAPVLALLTSGLTASIGLEVVGQLRPKETVLVTAAAGGAGQFVVQLAKAAGAHVIALCSSPAKATLLRKLGADRIINRKTDDLHAILKAEYPKGLDVVWETVGGQMFDILCRHLATGGRLLVIGLTSVYASGWPQSQVKGLPEQLLNKSASVRGFFLTHFARHYKAHFARLQAALQSGKLHVALDSRQFRGLQSVAEAVEHLHAGDSMGKVVVQVADDLPPAAASSL